MYNKAIDILKIFNDHGYNAFIVGGYPRDKMLGIKSNDIDICTDAKPKEIMEIFDTDGVSDIKYGYVRVIYKNSLFDVTTFRKDIKYENNRKPVKIKYVNVLLKDLIRRDFTINTICIDYEGNIIDLLDAKKDIDNRVIRTVGNPRYRLKEDSLRILRAIRFMGYLDFQIDKKTEYYIKKYSYLLKNLSGLRKREELDKIFMTKNKEKCVKYMISLGIDKALGINNMDKLILCNDIIGIWSQLELVQDYPFSKIEMTSIKKVREMLNLEITDCTIYKYGLYISTVVGGIRGISYRKINQQYNNLAINNRKDINIKAPEIMELLDRGKGEYLKDIIEDIEKKILDREIKNDREELAKYIVGKYKE